MAPLNKKPASQVRRNHMYFNISDEEMEQIDAYLKKAGFKDRSTFIRTCVMTVVRGELYVRND